MPQHADLILHNARIATVDRGKPQAQAVAVANGKFVAVGDDAEIMALADANTQVIDARGRRVIPGLIDSHLHVIRGGLNYNLELRWDGVSSLADAMRLLREQVARTPAPQWVRVVGGFSEHQFAEKRLPTLAELNAAAPDTPVFILHLYDRALLNAAALRATGYTRDTPNPPGGEIVRDANGEPTGLLLAKPNAMLLYSALATGPKLPYDYQLNSTRHFMRELNRLGVTSVIDAGGGFQNYPDDYKVIADLHARSQLTLRIAYNLFTQKPKEELADFTRWTQNHRYQQGDDFYKLNGAGEMLVFSAADFEDFRQPRPQLAPGMEGELEAVVRTLAAKRWPWRLHATYDESIGRALDVFEKVHRDVPLDGIHWFFDHAETVGERNLERIARLGGGIAVQHRMAYQGEYFVERYGAKAAEATPPFKRMLELGIRVGAGTDATRVASYDPWTSLYWLTSGRTLGGTRLYPARNCLDRHEALDLYTRANTWFSNEQGFKGQIAPGQLADFAVLSDDYFSLPEERIREIVSVLTVVGGKIVYADAEFKPLDPPMPAPMPDWSPVNFGSRHWKSDAAKSAMHATPRHAACGVHRHPHAAATDLADPRSFWGALGCSCWAF
ncbi:MAG: amidohydrolase [Rudaea sp.]|uniref:amidohydrolase n=1 Tax=unclassified Rudaea TaxID=2627037 RepID=UPI0010F86259|nr:MULTISPECIES: amidohydrolase [unclassified Rudaea]MBN8887650.1 amidohydrolase [Rudaea sp.]MBR0345604.1 amidohydrolase [Rudaea sp.]